ncbi:conserved Plasmodium protein, unknown function [Plasmodium gallinaceum]|uniref:Vacuolar import/degradation Vid27 C-terminal domain-containing protein n=1 Tax=Plasmodium gallinaceum TaxID=5849 RepID=A0A1J1GX09_PLAGA|nr:conserved Plasmodium protein, unknown function [Plasmodium gallinaceum]CRG96999.1 conserved Plasmodium protein, unknown function [Plasmodium gallinaceum]
MIFNKFFKKKIELEVDLYVLKNDESIPLVLDAKLCVKKNEILIYNNSKKYIFYEDYIHNFKYHEMDMCQFKYLRHNVVEEYGLVFSDISNMYYFYKYIMFTYIKGNIILYKDVNLYKYKEPNNVLYKKNYYGILIFNTAKCEHLLIIVKSNRVKFDEDNEKDALLNKNNDTENIEKVEKEKIKDIESEKYYKEFTIENIKELYKRNKVFLIYILNSFNDIYLSSEYVGIHAKKYLFKNLFKFIEYKTLYLDGDTYKKYYIKSDNNKKNENKKIQNKLSNNNNNKDEISEDNLMNNISINDEDMEHILNEDFESIDKKIKEEMDNIKIKKENKKKNKNSKNEIDELKEQKNEENNNADDKKKKGEDDISLKLNKLNKKILIILDSDTILIDYIKKILIYRCDFKNDIVNIKQDYIDAHTKCQNDNEEKIYYELNDDETNKKKNYVLLSDSEESDNLNDQDDSDMKYKYLNTTGKFSFVIRQNYIPEKRKVLMHKNEKRENNVNYFDNINNDLNIYKFDEYGKEKKIYNSNKDLFKYKNEKCIPKNFHVNDNEGNKMVFLDEKNENNIFMIDVNTEKIVEKWDTEYIPVAKLLKKEENIYCGYNKNSLYYVDTRMKSCIQNLLQYNKNASNIEHASIDEKGRIILTNSQGELKYYDGKLNNSNVIKRSKNVVFCANDIVHLTASSDGLYSVITCEKNVIICENTIENNTLFEVVIKKCDRIKQKKILLQIHYVDVFTYNLGDYKFIKSIVNHDNSFIFTLSQNFYVVWNFKQAMNENISYIIKKVNENISDISFFNVNNIQGIIMATENSLKSKKIKNT